MTANRRGVLGAGGWLGAVMAALVVGAGGASYYWMPTTTTTTSTVRPEEACRLPCSCLRLSRWTPRMRAHCVVFWVSDRRPIAPFRLDSAVDEVDFSRSRIRKLYAFHLEGLERVKVLKMNGVGLTAVTTNAFDQLAELWSLSLQGNHLSSLPAVALARLDHLHHLSLSKNPLTVQPGQPLVAAASLQVLDLSDCGIRAVYDDTFLPLRNLRTLHLEGNQLRQLPDGVTAPLSQLSRLFLQRNQLLFFPSGAIKNLPQLLELRLDSNRLMEGPLGPLVAPRLQRLSAPDCALDSVEPDLLAAAPELRYLDLQANRLHSLWLANQSAETRLVLLDLARNPLECDCALRDTWLWAEKHVDQASVYCGQPPQPWHLADLNKLHCSKRPGPSAGSAEPGGADALGGEAGATALWVSLSLLAVVAAVGGALLCVYRQEVLARYFSPQARAAASGGGDALPLEHNSAEDGAAGAPSQEGGVALPPWVHQ